jgi:3-hydroxyisobutyrate dehydrogenase-like beta-hydroxyacid dehydrogenase
MSDVSMIGLGAMGAALAQTLLKTGYTVTVWNRTRARTAPLIAAGAVGAESARVAFEASDLVLVCIMTHTDTRALLADSGADMAGRTLVELSTGSPDQAEGLVIDANAMGARCLIGMIATFPGDIGKAESAIVTVGDETAWEASRDVLMALGGKSSYIGPNVRALPALFAGLFLPRQAFMFGMIYGALVCKKAGISMDDYVAQLPLTLKVVHDYYDVFAQTVPAGRFEDPPASVAAYKAAFQDVVETFEANDVRRDLPMMLDGLMQEAVDAGLSDKHVTALTQLFATDD